jgi:hypothetical protein
MPAAETPSGITRPGTQGPVVVKLAEPGAKPASARPTGARAAAKPMIGAGLVQARSMRWPLHWIAAIAAVVAAAPIAYYLTRDSSDAVAGATAPPVAPGPPMVPPLPTSEPAPTRPEPRTGPSKVRVRITTRPADATVLLDNKRLGHTPLDETVAADPGKHVIKLRRKGYALHRLDVTLDADVTEDIPLTPQK